METFKGSLQVYLLFYVATEIIRNRYPPFANVTDFMSTDKVNRASRAGSREFFQLAYAQVKQKCGIVERENYNKSKFKDVK